MNMTTPLIRDRTLSEASVSAVADLFRGLPEPFSLRDALATGGYCDSTLGRVLALMTKRGQLERLQHTSTGHPYAYRRTAAFPATMCPTTSHNAPTGQPEAKEPVLSAMEKRWREFRAAIAVEVEDHMRDWTREGELHSKAMGRTVGRGRGR